MNVWSLTHYHIPSLYVGFETWHNEVRVVFCRVKLACNIPLTWECLTLMELTWKWYYMQLLFHNKFFVWSLCINLFPQFFTIKRNNKGRLRSSALNSFRGKWTHVIISTNLVQLGIVPKPHPNNDSCFGP